MTKPIPILGKPGIKRDGTMLDGQNFYVDGLWCRFQRGRPRKMGGYRSINKQLSGFGRAIHSFSTSGLTYLHIGSQTALERTTVNNATGVSSGIVDRTPVGFTSSDDNCWQIDELFDSVAVNNLIIAHAAPWASDISDETERPVYVGDHTGTAALTAVASVGPSGTGVSGGIAVFYPYAFYFGSDGYVQWTVALQPSDTTGAGSGETRISADKVVRGLPLRAGPGNAPAGLFWSLSSLIRVTFVGGTAIFNFDTISTGSSILSPSAIIEHDGVYYWPGIDRFLMFNGVVQEIPNDMNTNWFFKNLNYDQLGKIYAYKVPRFNEIWWCYPRGTATECTHAIILQPRNGTWYDTELPEGGRSCGVYPQTQRYPFMVGVQDDDITGKKVLWQQEFGVDKQDGSNLLAIRSYFETHPIFPGLSGDNAELSCEIVEPDFEQVGPLSMTVTGRQTAKAVDVDADPISIVETPATPEEQLACPRTTRRQMRFRFESNSLGGDYQAGSIVAQVERGGEKLTGAV